MDAHEEGEEEDATGLAVRYQQLGLGRLTRRVSHRRRSSLANHLRSIYLDAQVRMGMGVCTRDDDNDDDRLWWLNHPTNPTCNAMQFVHAVVRAYREQQQEQAGTPPQPPPASAAAASEAPFAVFANLRNGEWYLPPGLWDGRVYFKVKRLVGCCSRHRCVGHVCFVLR